MDPVRERLVAFINRLNDLPWGPLERLRPPKEVDIDGPRFARLCFLGTVTTVAGLVLALWVAGLVLYFARYERLPPLAAVAWKPVQIVTQLWWLLLAAGAAYPLLFWPYVVCWNRRAGDRRRNPAPTVPQDGVWPPPPRRD